MIKFATRLVKAWRKQFWVLIMGNIAFWLQTELARVLKRPKNGKNAVKMDNNA